MIAEKSELAKRSVPLDWSGQGMGLKPKLKPLVNQQSIREIQHFRINFCSHGLWVAWACSAASRGSGTSCGRRAARGSEASGGAGGGERASGPGGPGEKKI